MKSRYWRMGIGADGMREIVTYLAVGAGLLRVLSRPSYVGCFGCSFFDQALPGAARQPLTFLAPPRKVSKRRVGALLQHNWVVAPSRFPAPAGTNREGKTTRCAQTFFPSFSDLHLPSPATLKRTSRPARFALPGMARLRHCAFKVFLCHQLVRRFSKHHPQRYNASCFRCALLIACGGYPNTRRNARRIRSGSSKPTARAMFSNDSSPASTRGRAASARSFSIALAGVCPVSALKARSNWRRLRQAISARRSALSDSCKWLRA